METGIHNTSEIGRLRRFCCTGPVRSWKTSCRNIWNGCYLTIFPI